MLTKEDFQSYSTIESFKKVIKSKISNKNFESLIDTIEYESELLKLQAELVDLQQWTAKHKMRVCVLFEGRDAAGKGGAIRRFTEHLNPRSMRVVALPKPTEIEKGNGILGAISKNYQSQANLYFLIEVGIIGRLWSPSWIFVRTMHIISLWFKFLSLNICFMRMVWSLSSFGFQFQKMNKKNASILD